MKRLLIATSVLALSLGGVAFAQSGSGGGAMNNPGASMGGGAGAGEGTSGTSGMNGASGANPSGGSYSQENPGGANPSAAQSTSGKGQASADEIKQAQQVLKQQGLYKGQVDGRWGPETRTAVSQFQKQQGLRQTAQLDQQTIDQLQNSGGGGGGGGAGAGGAGGMGGGGAGGGMGAGGAGGGGAGSQQ